jgi:hypothetical protein
LPQTARESGLTMVRSVAKDREAAAEGAAPERWLPAGERGVPSPGRPLDRPVELSFQRYGKREHCVLCVGFFFFFFLFFVK